MYPGVQKREFLGIRIPALFFKRIKMPFFLEYIESSLKKSFDITIIKLECSESRKIRVLFLPFLSLKIA